MSDPATPSPRPQRETGESAGADTPMRTVRFTVPSIAEDRDARDLQNALVSVAGIAHIEVDRASHIVTVEYDAGYVGEETLRRAIQRSGYPLEEP